MQVIIIDQKIQFIDELGNYQKKFKLYYLLKGSFKKLINHEIYKTRALLYYQKKDKLNMHQ